MHVSEFGLPAPAAVAALAAACGFLEAAAGVGALLQFCLLLPAVASGLQAHPFAASLAVAAAAVLAPAIWDRQTDSCQAQATHQAEAVQFAGSVIGIQHALLQAVCAGPHGLRGVASIALSPYMKPFWSGLASSGDMAAPETLLFPVLADCAGLWPDAVGARPAKCALAAERAPPDTVHPP